MVTESQLHILHHTLGLRPDRREPYRNYFVAGPGHHSMADIESLVESGLMVVARSPSFLDKDDITFMVTSSGREYAIDNLPPEPKRTKYEEYLRSECCESFSEWLGINKPEYDYRGYGPNAEYRMFRRSGYDQFNGVTGDWCKTMKDAKASYKEALKAGRFSHGY